MYKNLQLLDTFVTATDLSSKNSFIVEVVSAFTIACAANQRLEGIGVLQNFPRSGEHGTVCLFGQTKIHAGDTIIAGDHFYQASGGYAVAVSSGMTAAAGLTIVGRALTAAASGYLFTGWVNPFRIPANSAGLIGGIQ